MIALEPDMRHHYLFPLVLGLAYVLVACSNTAQRNDVWQIYDVRHPVRADSTVPDGYARQYDRYVDHDSYYRAPDCGVMDSPACAD
jgi:hypothetical protein